MTLEQLNEFVKDHFQWYQAEEAKDWEPQQECPVFVRNGSHSALACYRDTTEEDEFTESMMAELRKADARFTVDEADDDHLELEVEVED